MENSTPSSSSPSTSPTAASNDTHDMSAASTSPPPSSPSQESAPDKDTQTTATTIEAAASSSSSALAASPSSLAAVVDDQDEEVVVPPPTPPGTAASIAVAVAASHRGCSRFNTIRRPVNQFASTSTQSSEALGCGVRSMGTTGNMTPHAGPITLNVSTTTGGNYTVEVDNAQTVASLKKIIAKKLKLAKDRICLLHRDRELQDGTLIENGLQNESRVILLPTVETGLLAQRPENTVMQALESLNDNQVNDFLSGKTPLNLSMRLGDHMMLIQLQLSTVTPTAAAAAAASVSSSASGGVASACTSQSATTSAGSTASASSSGAASSSSVRSSSSHLRQSIKSRISSSIHNNFHHNNQQQQHQHPHHPSAASTSTTTQSTSPLYRATTSTSSNSSTSTSTINCSGPESTKLGTSARTSHRYNPHQRNSLPPQKSAENGSMLLLQQTPGRASTSAPSTPVGPSALEQSPITSLSNLVSSPLQTAVALTKAQQLPPSKPLTSSTQQQQQSNAPTSGNGVIDPVTFTPPCICRRLNAAGVGAMTQNACADTPHHCSVPSTADRAMDEVSDDDYVLSPLYEPTGSHVAQLHHSLLLAGHNRTANNPIGRRRHADPLSPAAATMLAAAQAADMKEAAELKQAMRRTKSSDNFRTTNSHHNHNQSAGASSSTIDQLMDTSNSTTTLAEASRSLTQTLRKLSKEVFTNKSSSGSGAGSSTSSNSTSASQSSSVQRKSSSSSNAHVAGNRASSASASASSASTTGSAVASGSSSSSSSTTTSSAVLSSGAVIESMKNHGKGIYSGTFSGTLNPALQDRNGRPKRDISTVIHILNDLLSATPHYTRGARICFEPTTAVTAQAGSSSAMAASGSSRSIKQSSSVRQHHHHSSATGSTRIPSSAAAVTTAASNAGGPPVLCCSKCHAVLPQTAIPVSKILSVPRTTTTPTRCQQLAECNAHQPHAEKTAKVKATANALNLSAASFATGASLMPPSSHCRCSRALQFDEDDISTSSSTTTGSMAPNLIQSLTSGLHDTTASSADSTIQSCTTSGASPAAGPLLCAKCSTVERENSQTKSKLDQLRLVMQQKKARREARKLQTAPYSPPMPTNKNLATATQCLQPTAATSTGGPASTQSAPASPANSSPSGQPVEMTAAAPMPDIKSNSSNNNSGSLAEEVDTAA